MRRPEKNGRKRRKGPNCISRDAESSSTPGRGKAAKVMRRHPDGPAQRAPLHCAGMSLLSLSNPLVEDAAG